MGWRVSSVMDEKLRFVFEFEHDEESMKALCARFGVSRETGYVCCGAIGRMACPA